MCSPSLLPQGRRCCSVGVHWDETTHAHSHAEQLFEIKNVKELKFLCKNKQDQNTWELLLVSCDTGIQRDSFSQPSVCQNVSLCLWLEVLKCKLVFVLVHSWHTLFLAFTSVLSPDFAVIFSHQVANCKK